MVSQIPPPDPRALLPPILACLPTAFVSPRPPPALLPLLSPILRQRVHIQSQSVNSSDSWLPLLCWAPAHASNLSAVVEKIQIEPHPVSGEVELEDVETIRFRRLDEETLHARLDVEQFNLSFIYLWCMADEKNGGSSWKLAELRAFKDGDDGGDWHASVGEAGQGSRPGRTGGGSSTSNGTNGSSSTVENDDSGSDDDDAYWAAYDRTPGRTPAKHSPAPNASSVQLPSNSELEYFARYMAEVQPAMDPHDPSEEGIATGESTLNGGELVQQRPTRRETADIGPSGHDSSDPPPYTNGTQHDPNIAVDGRKEPEIEHPRPSSSSSAGSVNRLERRAEALTKAEVAIKQHISTDLKSLFRLARTAGIERDEFERIVRTELDCLDLMDLDE